MPRNILELRHCWNTQGQGHYNEATWKVFPALLMWSILKERNRRLFEDLSYVFCLKLFLEFYIRLDCSVCS